MISQNLSSFQSSHTFVYWELVRIFIGYHLKVYLKNNNTAIGFVGAIRHIDIMYTEEAREATATEITFLIFPATCEPRNINTK